MVAIHQRADIRADPISYSPESFHTAAYRQYILWVYKKLGRGNRRMCPSCVVMAIREWYPSPTGMYMGYKDCWSYISIICSIYTQLITSSVHFCSLLIMIIILQSAHHVKMIQQGRQVGGLTTWIPLALNSNIFICSSGMYTFCLADQTGTTSHCLVRLQYVRWLCLSLALVVAWSRVRWKLWSKAASWSCALYPSIM